MERVYDVKINTPIGIQVGVISIDAATGSGVVHIFDADAPFTDAEVTDSVTKFSTVMSTPYGPVKGDFVVKFSEDAVTGSANTSYGELYFEGTLKG